ncbi:MAG: hydroxyethylthiazole kinase [Desulfovibrio sp.]|jgi:hydroxyethylthiazole kinase
MDFFSTLMGDLERMRTSRPLVLNITNYVVANSNANALLALGASPAMTHFADDLEELTLFAGALVINIGTPSRELLDGVFHAGTVAKQNGIPAVLDPVAAGATTVRTEASYRFLKECSPAVVRGNASEIMALAGVGATSKGADSTRSADEAVDSARDVARMFQCAVSVSGATDYITDGSRTLTVQGGHEMMPLVTGLGCTATALTGAFLCVARDSLTAATEAMAVMSTAGSMAAEKAGGPGTLQLYFYDALYNLTLDDLRRHVIVEEV